MNEKSISPLKSKFEKKSYTKKIALEHFLLEIGGSSFVMSLQFSYDSLFKFLLPHLQIEPQQTHKWP